MSKLSNIKIGEILYGTHNGIEYKIIDIGKHGIVVISNEERLPIYVLNKEIYEVLRKTRKLNG